MQLFRFFKYTAAVLAMMVGGAQCASAYITHKVQRSETLWGLAKKYDVTPDDIINANPVLKRGLKTGQTIRIPEPADLNPGLVIPAASEQAAPAQPSAPAAKPEVTETLTDIDGLIDPAAGVAEVVTGVSVPAVAFETPAAKVKTNSGVNDVYVARFGDTMGSVSAKTGVEIETLYSLNPFAPAGRLPEGYPLRLSSSAPYVSYEAPRSRVDSIIAGVQIIVADEPQRPVAQTSSGARTVVVMLPFDVDNETISRQSLLATDFYKGFLLAVREDADRNNFPLRIVAIDTQCDADEFERRLNALADESVSVIIPTDDDQQLEKIESFAMDHNILVLNALNVRDEGYLQYPNVLQCNINQKLMYDKAISALLNQYPDYTPVILDLNGGKDEKASFIDELKRQYDQQGKDVINLSFRGKLSATDISSLPSKGKYVFIPKSGTTEVFGKIYEGLTQAVEDNAASDKYKVFGYPDWITYRGEHAEALHRMGATIYSRFFLDAADPVSQDVIDDYVRWYGVQMEEVYPSQGMLGYDAGKLLFSKLRRPATKSGTPDFQGGTYSGRQSTFHFVHGELGSGESAGLINDALYIIEYMPGEAVYGRTI